MAHIPTPRRIVLGLRRRILRFLLGKDAARFEAQRLLLDRNPLFKEYDIGAWSYGTPEIVRWSKDQTVSIGKYCSIAEGVTILLGGEHRTNFISTYPFGQFMDPDYDNQHEWSRGPVRIGNDVWMGRGATILSGVTVGDGAIIGAGAIVSKNVDPFEIVAGNPAKHVRYRFDPDEIQALIAIRWWEWSDEKAHDCIAELMSPDIGEFIRKHLPPQSK